MVKKEESPFLVFLIDNRRFALPVGVVERVVAAVEMTPLPNAPSFLRGVINCAGEIVPMIDLRVRFGLSSRAIRVSDRLIFIEHSVSGEENNAHLYAFLVESVEGVFSLDAEKITLPESSHSRQMIQDGRFIDDVFDGAMIGLERGDDRIVCIQTVEALFAMTDAEIQMFEHVCSSREGTVS